MNYLKFTALKVQEGDYAAWGGDILAQMGPTSMLSTFSLPSVLSCPSRAPNPTASENMTEEGSHTHFPGAAFLQHINRFSVKYRLPG